METTYPGIPALSGLTAEVTVTALTPQGVQLLTAELEWNEIGTRNDIPRGPGPYLWAAGWQQAAWYIGSGSGALGLWSRLGNQLRWAEEARADRDEWVEAAAAAGVVPDLLAADSLAMLWVPLVRTIAERGLRCFAATSDASSADAKTWEKRIQCANRIVSANSSILGGSAWEQSGEHWVSADAWAQQALRHHSAAAPPTKT